MLPLFVSYNQFLHRVCSHAWNSVGNSARITTPWAVWRMAPYPFLVSQAELEKLTEPLSVFREETRLEKRIKPENLETNKCISCLRNRMRFYCLQTRLMLLAISAITDRGSDNFLPVTQKRQHRLLSKDKTVYMSVAASTFFCTSRTNVPKSGVQPVSYSGFSKVAEPLDTVKDNFY